MKIYKYIATVKARDPKGKMPTHYLSAKENQGDKEGVLVASLWSKEYVKDGATVRFLAGEMKSQYTDHTDPSKSRDGYVVIKESDLNELMKLLGEQDVAIEESEPHPGDNIPF